MKTLSILMLLILTCFVSGCATGDRISQQNAHEAADTIEKYIDPALPDSAKNAAKAQAQAWKDYEDAKFK